MDGLNKHMKKDHLLKLHLLITTSSIMVVVGMLGFSTASASPTVAPPNGNPSFPAGPQGPSGGVGNTGNQGGQGQTGATGAKGATGTQGIAYCSWYNGNKWISHGWDSYCAWDSGMYLSCTSGRLTSITNVNGGCNGVWHGHSSHP